MRSAFGRVGRRVDGARIVLGPHWVLHPAWFGSDRIGCGLRPELHTRSFVHAAPRLGTPGLIPSPLDGLPSRRPLERRGGSISCARAMA